MSDRDEDEHSAKRRRSRACDLCRKKKVRCDGEEGKPCSTCVEFRSKCTYVESTERRYVDNEYVRALEMEVSRLQLLVRQLQAKLAQCEKSRATSEPMAKTLELSLPDCLPSIVEISFKKEETDEDEGIAEGFKCMNLDDARVRFMGRSSSFALIRAAAKMKQDLVKDEQIPLPGPVYSPTMFSNRRSEFWSYYTDIFPPSPPYTEFPEPVIMNELLDDYFRTIHVNFPLLHRPTFLQNIASGLHLVDEGFGATVLLVCALSARFSTNPVVLPPGSTNWWWAGWWWFYQVHAMRKLIPLTVTTLYDLQVAALSAAYVATLAVPQSNHAVLGHGLRLAEDAGAHRRMAYGSESTAEGELKKRAFWCLIAMDRGMCTALGSPCSLHDEDFDLDYLIECDDEYWATDDPQKDFKQPRGQPSTIAHFNCVLTLQRIYVHALRTIYSLQGAKILSDPERAQQVVAELDSELNQWVDSIPEHLKYDHNREDIPFAGQSASLYALYYNLRIFIHRPFLTMPRKCAPPPFPSFVICTNAARSCIQALDRCFALSGPAMIYQHHLASLFSSAVILLLHVWSETRSGSATDVAKELGHVTGALRIFKSLEERWSLAGRFWDIVHDLKTAVDSAQNSSSRGAHEHRRDNNVVPEQDAVLVPLTHMPQPSGQGSSTCVNGVHQQAPAAEIRSSSDYSQVSLNYAPTHGNGETLGTSVFWQNPSAQAGVETQAQPGPAPSLDGAYAHAPDPDLETIFADLLPTLSHQDPFAAMTHVMPSYFPSAQFFESAVPLGTGGSGAQLYVQSGGCTEP